MKKAMSTRELVLLALLIVLAAYYFVVQGPITKQMEAIRAEQTQVEDEISDAQNRLVARNRMESETEKALAEAGENLEGLPRYSNANAIMLEMNAIFSNTKDYFITFGDEIEENNIVRRPISIKFSADNYYQAKAKLKSISESSSKYLIGNMSVTENRDKNSGDSVLVTVYLTSFEYK